MSAYYNEIDPLKAETIREAIKAGAITPGDVDERSIADVKPDDLMGYTQCHFFAGGGFWSLALRYAGWPDDRPVWTGSCPCQSFSNAGKRKGKADPRHLWPEWIRLIRVAKPPVIFGEQVGAAGGGKSFPRKEMHSLRDREAVRRVLYELERISPRYLQIMHAGSGETPQAQQEGRSGGEPLRLASEATGLRAGECCTTSCEDQGIVLHSGPREHPDTDRPWMLRGDRHKIRPDEAQGMERSLFGQDHFNGGLHDGEHPGSDLLFECDGERLGNPKGCRGGERSIRTAFDAERRTARILERAFEETPDWSWFDSVRADVEREGYACGTTVFGAHSVGGPHIRQRLYFCAESESFGREREPLHRSSKGFGGSLCSAQPLLGPVPCGAASLNGSESHNPERRTDVDGGGDHQRQEKEWEQSAGSLGQYGSASFRSHADDSGRESIVSDHSFQSRLEGYCENVRDWRGPGWLNPEQARSIAEAGATRGFWADCDWWYGRDGRYRPIGSGLQPLAHGSPARVGRLRMYGDSIVVTQAQAFIEAYRESRGEVIA